MCRGYRNKDRKKKAKNSGHYHLIINYFLFLWRLYITFLPFETPESDIPPTDLTIQCYKIAARNCPKGQAAAGGSAQMLVLSVVGAY
jgi:hypothetical protein